MGLWSRRCESSLVRAETLLLSLSGIRSAFSIHDVHLSDGTFMHTVICGNSRSPSIVLLHGYCGGGMVFYRVISDLTKDFCLYLVDMLGMGQSSRPPFLAKTTEEAEFFFVSALEALRERLNLSSFILLGHSFGGYIAGCYATAYPQHVSQLLLLSPLGVTEKPKGYSFESALKSKSWTERAIWRAVKTLWHKQVTVADVIRKAGPLSGRLIRMYTRKCLAAVPEEELAVLECYLEQICLLPGCGEYSLPLILELGNFARRPLAPRLAELKMPMAFLYGERDWISPQGALQVKSQSRACVRVRVIPETGHQLFLERSETLLQELHFALGNPLISADMSSWEAWSGK